MKQISLILAIIVLAGCTDPKAAERVAAVAQCSASATMQGLAFGSPERNTFIATCVSAIVTAVVIEDVVEP